MQKRSDGNRLGMVLDGGARVNEDRKPAIQISGIPGCLIALFVLIGAGGGWLYLLSLLMD